VVRVLAGGVRVVRVLAAAAGVVRVLAGGVRVVRVLAAAARAMKTLGVPTRRAALAVKIRVAARPTAPSAQAPPAAPAEQDLTRAALAPTAAARHRRAAHRQKRFHLRIQLTSRTWCFP
jgi:hypothetical protein